MFTKEIVVRRDLGNRASPVNQAHMKRLQIMELLYSVPNLLDRINFRNQFLKELFINIFFGIIRQCQQFPILE